MSGIITLQLDGKPVRIRWNRDTAPTEADVNAIRADYRKQTLSRGAFSGAKAGGGIDAPKKRQIRGLEPGDNPVTLSEAEAQARKSRGTLDLLGEVLAGPGAQKKGFQGDSNYRSIIDELTDRATTFGSNVGGALSGPVGRFAGGHLSGMAAGVPSGWADAANVTKKAGEGGTLDLRDNIALGGVVIDALTGAGGAAIRAGLRAAQMEVRDLAEAAALAKGLRGIDPETPVLNGTRPPRGIVSELLDNPPTERPDIHKIVKSLGDSDEHAAATAAILNPILEQNPGAAFKIVDQIDPTGKLKQESEHFVSIDPPSLSREVLSKMDRALKSMGYDSRGADDVRQMLISRIAPNGQMSLPDWITAYEKATGSRAARMQALEAKKSLPNVNWSRIRQLGTTSDLREAGYIKPDGGLVDLSGKREGGPPGKRSLDHREAGGTAGMQELMSEGYIRMDHNSGSLDISKSPTSDQWRTIDRLVANHNGEVVIDLEDGLGELRDSYYLKPKRTFSREYPAGTRSARIRADIERFFSGDEPAPLNKFLQQGPEGVRGAYTPGSRVIELVQGKADFTTVIHEVVHDWHGYLAKHAEHGEVIRKYYGDLGNEAGAELFVNHFNRFLRTGKSPVKGMQSVFTAMRDWLKSIYQRISGGAVPKDVEAIFKKTYSKPSDETMRLVREFEDLSGKAKPPDPPSLTVHTNPEPSQVAGASQLGEGVLPKELRHRIYSASDEELMRVHEQIKGNQDYAQAQSLIENRLRSSNREPTKDWVRTNLDGVPPNMPLEEQLRLSVEGALARKRDPLAADASTAASDLDPDFYSVGNGGGGKPPSQPPVAMGDAGKGEPSKSALHYAKELSYIARGLKLGADVGALLRQGGEMLVNDPIQWAKSVGQGLSKTDKGKLIKHYQELQSRTINGKSMADVRKLAGLKTSMMDTEEAFASKLFDKIPGLNRLENFQRAFLDTGRIERFDAFYRKFPDATEKELKDYAKYINSAMGKSNLTQVKDVFEVLMTSPRWTASRWEMAGRILKSPATVAKAMGGNKAARQEVLNLARYSVALYGMLKVAESSGAEIDFDPRSSGFLKMRFGEKVFDPTSGVAAPIRASLRALLFMRGETSGSKNPASEFGQLASYTGNPLITSTYGLVTGENLTGYELDEDERGAMMLMPLIANGVKQTLEKDGPTAAAIQGLTELLGVNSNRFPKGTKPWPKRKVEGTKAQKVLDKVPL